MSTHDEHHEHSLPTSFWTRYVFSIDHKVIGAQFLFASMLFVILGGLFALGVRYQIAWPMQDVPYKAILPGKMTGAAPEPNPGLWKMGGRVQLSGDARLLAGGAVVLVSQGQVIYPDGTVLPLAEAQAAEGERRVDEAALAAAQPLPGGAEGVRAELRGFPLGLAVTLPAQTRVAWTGGREETLEEPLSGFVPASELMGSYDYSRQEVLAVAGTEVYLVPEPLDGAGAAALRRAMAGDPAGVRMARIAGRQVYRPGLGAGGAATAELDEGPVALPVRPQATMVALDVPAQRVKVSEAGRLESFPLDPQSRAALAAQLAEQQAARQTLEAQAQTARQAILAQAEELRRPFEEQAAEIERRFEAQAAQALAQGEKVAQAVIDLARQQLDEASPAFAQAQEQAEQLRRQAQAQAQKLRDQGQARAQGLREQALARVDRLTKVADNQAQAVRGREPAPWVMAPVSAATLPALPAGSVSYLKDALTTDAYLQLFTMHATIMIFFVIIPALVGAFGNFLIPLMVGAKDMAFPKLNMLSFWLAFPSGILLILSFWTLGGPAGGGWTMYPTLSEVQFSQQLGTTLWIVAVGMVGFSSVVGAFNYITTIVNMRAPGMTMFRMPLTVWSLLITSSLALFGTPVLTAAMVMLLLDRLAGTTFFLPAGGGQPLLFQHLFWFYSHPAVYIMILPAMGMVSDVLSTFARKPIFGYRPMVFAMAAIAGLGYIVWGHHMFQSGMNPVLGTTFMASTIMIAVPSAIKTFNWLGTLWGGNIRFTPAMLNALGFVSMFVIGGLSGIFMASAPVDIHIHDTYFIVAHIHYVLFGGSIFGIFAGIYYWFPKMFGRQLNQKWGVIHFILTIIAFNGTFFLMHILGVGGHPRRYASIMEYGTLQHLQPMNVFMTLWALALGAAQIPFFYNLFASLPGKLGRAIVATFAVALCVPMVIGLSWYANADGEAAHAALSGLMDWALRGNGEPGYGPLGTAAGYLFSLGGLAALLGGLLYGLPRAGKVWAACLGLPLLLYGLSVMSRHLAGELVYPTGDGGQPILMQTVDLIQTALWSPLTGEVLIAVGHGVLAGLVLVAVVFAVWWLGGLLRMAAVLPRVLTVVVLPLWLSPFVLKQDAYLLVDPGLFQYRWWILGLLGLPGLLYLVLRRPRDVFGAAAEANPWHANSLEWATTSPPPATNFDVIPTVYRGPYEYSSPVVAEDYLPQPRELPRGVLEPAGH